VVAGEQARLKREADRNASGGQSEIDRWIAIGADLGGADAVAPADDALKLVNFTFCDTDIAAALGGEDDMHI
jgi:hypothetical protein